MASNDRLTGLDFLRFAAAASVMLAHYGDRYAPAGMPAWHLTGALAVNVFFVISGLVITRSVMGSATAGRFAARRAARLFPAFLICLLLTIPIEMLRGAEFSAGQVIGNLTMVPNLLGVEPICGVYWTLSQEWAFYALAALTFPLLRRHPLGVIAAWVAIGFSQRIAGVSNPTLMLLSNRDFAPLFAAGMILSIYNPARRMQFAAIAVLLIAASAGGPWSGPAWQGAAFASFYLGCFLFCVGLVAAFSRLRVPRRLNQLALLAGGASYPLYLIHAPVADLFELLVAPNWATIAASSLASVVLSAVIAVWLEAPLRRAIGRLRQPGLVSEMAAVRSSSA